MACARVLSAWAGLAARWWRWQEWWNWGAERNACFWGLSSSLLSCCGVCTCTAACCRSPPHCGTCVCVHSPCLCARSCTHTGHTWKQQWVSNWILKSHQLCRVTAQCLGTKMRNAPSSRVKSTLSIAPLENTHIFFFHVQQKENTAATWIPNFSTPRVLGHLQNKPICEDYNCKHVTPYPHAPPHRHFTLEAR